MDHAGDVDPEVPAGVLDPGGRLELKLIVRLLEVDAASELEREIRSYNGQRGPQEDD